MVIKEQFTDELKDTIQYMSDTLVNEFPTEILTPEYMMLAMLDNNGCHANLILENSMMSSNIEKLRGVYVSFLDSVTNKNASIDREKIRDSKEMMDLFEAAESEATDLSSSKVGTEHVLLAMTNKKRNLPIMQVLNSAGLKYEYIKSKCEQEEGNDQKQDQSKKKRSALPKIETKTPAKKKNEYIETFTENLNALARSGQIDKLVGREKELRNVYNVMARRNKNNAIIVGKSGCGCTHLVNGIANAIEDGLAPSYLDGKEIVKLNMTKAVAGANFRGMLEERIGGLFEELSKSNKYILFIDDIHTTSGKDKDTDITDMIGQILSEGKVPVIATTNFQEYRKNVESKPQLCRKFQKIVIEPTTREETLEILKQNKSYYEEYHNVKYSDDVLKKIVDLSDRYMTSRALPDSAIDVMDTVGARSKIDSADNAPQTILRRKIKSVGEEKQATLNKGDFETAEELTVKENLLKKELADCDRNYEKHKEEYAVHITEDMVMNVVSDVTGIPSGSMDSNERDRVANIDKELKKYVIGQDEAVDIVSRVIKRNKVGLGDKTKTLMNLLMVGPSGCGKSLIAKKLAEQMFGSEKDLVRIDMSEYSEKHSVSKLTGAAPGYIGYDNGGQLTEAIKNKPYCVLLLDEIEKADPEVYNIFLQLFDDGRLTDSSGQLVDFKNVIIIMTSNLGARQAEELGRGVGFAPDETKTKRGIIDKAIKKFFPPEFLNRIDKIIHFNYLSDENLREIVKIEVGKLAKRVEDIGYGLEVQDSAIDYIHGMAIEEKKFGARPITRIIQDKIEDKLTDIIIETGREKGYKFTVSCDDKENLTIS